MQKFLESKNRKSIFENPIQKLKTKSENELRNLNFPNPEFENRFSKNETRNPRFPKSENRFEKFRIDFLKNGYLKNMLEQKDES